MSCTFPDELIEQTIDFHGHSCPGLTIGIRAAELALREIDNQKNMVAISETDMCGVDAIQFLTNCTYGKGNFLHRDYGKMAFSFYDRTTGKGIRIVMKQDAQSEVYSEFRMLMKKEGTDDFSAKDKNRLTQLRTLVKEELMANDLDDMFSITRLKSGAPRPAMILESLICECCGESTMESRTRRMGNKTLCIPCFNEREQKI